MRTPILGAVAVVLVGASMAGAAAAPSPKTMVLQPADVPGWRLEATGPISEQAMAVGDGLTISQLRQRGFVRGYARTYAGSGGGLSGVTSSAITYTKVSGAKTDMALRCRRLANDRAHGGTFKPFPTQGPLGDAACAYKLVRQGSFYVGISFRYRTAVAYLISAGASTGKPEDLLPLARKQQARMKAAFR